MDFDVYVLATLARQRLDDRRAEARLHALVPHRAGRRRVRAGLGVAVVALGSAVGRVGGALVGLGRRMAGDAAAPARP